MLLEGKGTALLFPVPDAVELVASTKGPGLVSPSVEMVEPASMVEVFEAEEMSVLAVSIEGFPPMALSAGVISDGRPSILVEQFITEETWVPAVSIEEAPSIAVSADLSGEGRSLDSRVVEAYVLVALTEELPPILSSAELINDRRPFVAIEECRVKTVSVLIALIVEAPLIPLSADLMDDVLLLVAVEESTTKRFFVLIGLIEEALPIPLSVDLISAGRPSPVVEVEESRRAGETFGKLVLGVVATPEVTRIIDMSLRVIPGVPLGGVL